MSALVGVAIWQPGKPRRSLECFRTDFKKTNAQESNQKPLETYELLKHEKSRATGLRGQACQKVVTDLRKSEKVLLTFPNIQETFEQQCPPPPATCCCSFTKSLLDGTGHRLLLASYMERKKQLVTTEAASLVSANYQTIWEQIEKQTSRKVMVVKYPELYLM